VQVFHLSASDYSRLRKVAFQKIQHRGHKLLTEKKKNKIKHKVNQTPKDANTGRVNQAFEQI
jgi:hypothetical protein